MNDQWSPKFFQKNILFSQISYLSRHFSTWETWPSLLDYNCMKQSIRGEIQSLSGASLEFVAQDKKTSIPNQSYEARIYLKGEIQTGLKTGMISFRY